MRLRYAVIGLAIMLGLSAQARGQIATFRTAMLAANSGRTATGIAVGDFDEDGALDAVTSNSSNGTVTVFLQFFGELFPDHDVVVGGVPDAVIAGGFNGDDHLDLVVANGNDSVLCLAGDGDGQFEAGEPAEVGAKPSGLASGDFNDDGMLDVAVANEGESEGAPGSVSVLLGVGDCTFTTAATLAGAGRTWAVAVGDVDGDDDDDIVAINGRASSCSVFLNDGTGTSFSSAGTFATGPEPTGVALARMNADAALDVVVSERNADAVSVFLGDGAGGFTLREAHPVGTFPSAVAVGDIDGDGSTDVLATNDLSGDVSLLRGDGTGDLATARSFVVDGQPVAVVLGDVDGDEKTDVLTANVVGSDGSVAILRNRGAGVLNAVEDVAVAMGPAGVSIGDFDDDALPDVVLAHESGTVLVFAAQAAEGFAVRDTIAPGGQLRRVTAVDLNGDGRLDLAVADNSGDRILVMLGRGDGTFGTPAVLATGAGPAAVASGDFDGDGETDLAASVFGPPSEVTVFLGRGDGTFEAPCSTAAGEAPVEIVARNLDVIDADPLDRKDDLVVVNEGSDTVQVLWSEDGCSFSSQTLAGRGPKGVALGLFDADTKPDVIVGNSVVSVSQPSIQVFLGNGDRTFRLGPTVRGNRVDALTARDFTADGIADLAAVDQTSNMLQMFRGRGDGRFVLDSEVNVSRMPVSVAAADFDGDGRYDTATANSHVTANNMSVLTNCAGEPVCLDAPAAPARGDGNADGAVSAADLVAVAREVPDGDGWQIEDITRTGFAAGAGVDANGDGRVDAQDRGAAVHRIFSRG